MALLDEIGTHLTNQGVVEGSTTWALALSFMPPGAEGVGAHKVVALFETGGDEPDNDPSGANVDRPRFQVRVRGAVRGYEEARAKVYEVFQTLHNAAPTGFTYIMAVESGPIALGLDANDRPELSWNFRSMRTRAA